MVQKWGRINPTHSSCRIDNKAEELTAQKKFKRKCSEDIKKQLLNNI